MNNDIASEARIHRNIRSLLWWRWVFLLLAFMVPAVLYGLFERHARRLEALGDHGQSATATVTRLSQDRSVFYTYAINGTNYTWSVAQSDAPYAVGQSFSILYLPEDPSLSRPGSDRSKATKEAAANRNFTWKVVTGVFVFFFLCLVLCEINLRRLRTTGLTEWNDPQAYRRRLIFTGIMFLPFVLLIVGLHANDALRRKESLWPIALGLMSWMIAIGGTAFYLSRKKDVSQVLLRSARILRWVAPLAVVVAMLRILIE